MGSIPREEARSLGRAVTRKGHGLVNDVGRRCARKGFQIRGDGGHASINGRAAALTFLGFRVLGDRDVQLEVGEEAS